MRKYLKALMCLTAIVSAAQAQAARKITLTLDAIGDGYGVTGYDATGAIYSPIRFATLTVVLENLGSDPNYFTYFGSGPLVQAYFNGSTINLSTAGTLPSYYQFAGTGTVCGVASSAPATSSADAACSNLTYTTSSPNGIGSRFTGAITRYAIAEGDSTGGRGLILTTIVPEPSTWALMLAGFAVTGYALRRRKVAFA